MYVKLSRLNFVSVRRQNNFTARKGKKITQTPKNLVKFVTHSDNARIYAKNASRKRANNDNNAVHGSVNLLHLLPSLSRSEIDARMHVRAGRGHGGD